MKIRRFYSKNMRNALKQVTDEFGNDAAILSSQKTPSGVEVIAALDYDEALLPESISSLAKSKNEVEAQRTENVSDLKNIGNAAGNEKPSVNLVEKSDPTGFSSHQYLQEIENQKKFQSSSTTSKQSNNKIEELQPEFKNRIDQQAFTDSPSTNTANVEWSTDPGLIAMKEELGLMRSMMKEQLDGIGWQRLTERDPITAMLNRRLSSLGVSQSIIERLVPNVASNGTHQLIQQKDPECSWQSTLAKLAKSIPLDATNVIANGGILTLMGPTGSGKTTTIAKLAARYVIKHGPNSVALITTDSHRAVGRLQLQNFAKLLKVPVAQVSEKQPLHKLIDGFADKKLILIDTSSIDINDIKQNKNLDCLENYNQNNPHKPIKKLLLLPAIYQHKALEQIVHSYARFSPDSCIISKIDEAVSLGEVISLLVEFNLPVAYTTDGQKVPENIRVARNHHLVSKAVWLANKRDNQAVIAKENQAKVAVKANNIAMKAVS